MWVVCKLEDTIKQGHTGASFMQIHCENVNAAIRIAFDTWANEWGLDVEEIRYREVPTPLTWDDGTQRERWFISYRDGSIINA